MKLGRNSLAVRVLLPIFLVISAIAGILQIIVNDIAGDVSDEYDMLRLSEYAASINKIVDTAVSELVSANLLDTEVVAEAKKRAAIEDISLY